MSGELPLLDMPIEELNKRILAAANDEPKLIKVKAEKVKPHKVGRRPRPVGGKKVQRDKPGVIAERQPTRDEISVFMWRPKLDPLMRQVDIVPRRNGALPGMTLVPVGIQTWIDRFGYQFQVTVCTHEHTSSKYSGEKLRELRAERGCGRPPKKLKKRQELEALLQHAA